MDTTLKQVVLFAFYTLVPVFLRYTVFALPDEESLHANADLSTAFLLHLLAVFAGASVIVVGSTHSWRIATRCLTFLLGAQYVMQACSLLVGEWPPRLLCTPWKEYACSSLPCALQGTSFWMRELLFFALCAMWLNGLLPKTYGRDVKVYLRSVSPVSAFPIMTNVATVTIVYLGFYRTATPHFFETSSCGWTAFLPRITVITIIVRRFIQRVLFSIIMFLAKHVLPESEATNFFLSDFEYIVRNANNGKWRLWERLY